MLYAIIGMLVVIADQYIKFWTQGHISLASAGEEFIPGILSLVNVHNDGAAFGFLSGSGARIPFIILAGVFTLAVIIALATKLISGKLARWSIVLVTAGGLSNCLDRVMYGYVQDMFKTEFINFPVFNLADVFITIFAIIFALAVIFGKTRKDTDDDYDEFEDEEEEEQPRTSKRKAKRSSRRRAKDYDDYDEEDDEEEDEPEPVRKPRKQARKQRAAAVAEEEEAPVPVSPARTAPAKKAAAKRVSEDANEDPFAGWERTAAKGGKEKTQPAKAAQRTERPAAKTAAASTQTKPVERQAAAVAKPAVKQVETSAVEEEFSLDDILNEFR